MFLGVPLGDNDDKAKKVFDFCNQIGNYKDGYINDEVIQTWLRGAHEPTIINYEKDDGSAYFDKAYIAYETLKKEIDKTDNKNIEALEALLIMLQDLIFLLENIIFE